MLILAACVTFGCLGLLASATVAAYRLVLQLGTRRMDLIERALEAEERRQAERTKALTPPVIPPDLVRRILAWGTTDAQDAERKSILDLYQEFAVSLDPWADVRRHLAPAPDDTPPVELMA